MKKYMSMEDESGQCNKTDCVNYCISRFTNTGACTFIEIEVDDKGRCLDYEWEGEINV